MGPKGGWGPERGEARRKGSEGKSGRGYKEEYGGREEAPERRKGLEVVEELEGERKRLLEEVRVERAKNEFMEAEIDRENYPLGFDFRRFQVNTE